MVSTLRKYSRQRQAILDVIKSTDIHPTADWIYQKVRNKIENISLGTVYRNLKILSESGEIQELNFNSSVNRYDGVIENHHHLICTSCGQVKDIFLDFPTVLASTINSEYRFDVESVKTDFYGLCHSCK